MKCKYEKCDNEAVGRSLYCSDTCKTLYNRNKSVTAGTVTPNRNNSDGQDTFDPFVKPSHTELRTVTDKEIVRPPCKRLDVYCHACTDEPTCEYRAKQNTALPGDDDYEGVCAEVEGIMVIG